MLRHAQIPALASALFLLVGCSDDSGTAGHDLNASNTDAAIHDAAPDVPADAAPGVDGADGAAPDSADIDGTADGSDAMDAGVESGLDAADAQPDGGAAVDALTQVAATAICGALFRCCDGASMNDYFAAATAKPSLSSFAIEVPPAVTLDEAECLDVVKRMLDVVPFKDWVALAKAGHVAFDDAAAADCAATLESAACGQPLADALFDGTCFGFEPPAGGASQRAAFHRSAGVGDGCQVLTSDGFGAGFFGTCDPSVGFCCYEAAANPGECAMPGEGLTGTCVAAGNVGDNCSSMPPLQLCRTGLSCDGYTAKCDADVDASLAIGDPCADTSWTLLGDCVDGWCDLFGSKACEPWKVDGDSCFASSECSSRTCKDDGAGSVCMPWTFCAP